jgi:hypothetical protein
MHSVSICLDSGRLATSNCKNDVRGDRVQSVLVYSSDRPSSYCSDHTSVSVCTGGGVATEYCKKFAEVDSGVKISEKSLLKLTQSDVDEINRARNSGLSDTFLSDNYVYLVTSGGGDATFKGINGKLKQSPSAPYLLCPVHTKEAWDRYTASLPPVEPDPSTPSAHQGISEAQ